jgi:thiol reductant ABC exporter CydD subunit
LIDPHLRGRIALDRRFAGAAVLMGLLATAAVIAQAVLMAGILADAIEHRSPVGHMTLALIGVGLAFGARAATGWAGQLAAARTSRTAVVLLRQKLLRHATDLGPVWLSGERAGELAVTATRGVDALEAYYGSYLPRAVLAVVAPVGILIWLGWADWPSLLILLVLLALIPLALVHFGRRARRETDRQWRRMSSLSARFLELLQGLPTLRALRREAYGRREVQEATESLRVATLRTLRVSFLSALSLEMLAGLGTGLVAMLLGLRLLQGAIPLATAIAVLLVAPEVFIPLRRASTEYHASTEGQAAARRIVDVLDTPSPTATSVHAGPQAPAPEGAPQAVPDASVAPLHIADLAVRYPGRSAPVLSGIDLEVAPGDHVVVTGPSGSGKSTLLAAILRFVEPDEGAITLGDIALGAIDVAAWRRQLAWVPQRPHLFEGTWATNLRMGGHDISDAALWEVAEACGLRSLLEQLPAGLDTVIGERGLTLSAGERQRIAIGRALLRDAPIMLLDEPASHLDEDTERELAGAIAPFLAGRTVLVAAHRPQLLETVDRVLDLPAADGGSLVLTPGSLVVEHGGAGRSAGRGTQGRSPGGTS